MDITRISPDAIFILDELADWIDNRTKTTKTLAQAADQPYAQDFYKGAQALIADLQIFCDYITTELDRVNAPKTKAKIIPFIPRKNWDGDYD